MSSTASSQPPKRLSFLEDFSLAGTAAGVSKTAAAPIERVKLLMQTEKEMLKSGVLDRPYNGVVDCVVRTYKSDGIIGFWKGNGANIIRYFPTQAINFALKPFFNSLFPTQQSDSYLYKLGANITSGGLAGIGSLSVVYSLDFIRTRLAADSKSAKHGGKAQFDGMIHCYRKILKSDGITGLYRGFVISSVGIFIYRGLYFGLYDTVKALLPKNNFLTNFALGWGVTTVAGLASYPIDTIRRRMMMLAGETVKYSSSIEAASLIYRTEGIKAFYKGTSANIIRGIAGAGVLSGFDLLQDYYIYYRTGVRGGTTQFKAGS